MNAIKHYLSFFFVVSLIMGITMSCGNQPKKESAETKAITVVEIDELLANFDASIEKTVQIEGVCTHICQHGGTKIFLMGNDETKSIKVEAGEKLGSFKSEAVNSIVRVTGVCKETRIDEAYLLEMEAEAHHGHDHAEGETCAAEQMANGNTPANGLIAQIANYRSRIAAREESEGKAYLSFYYIESDEYSIVVDEN